MSLDEMRTNAFGCVIAIEKHSDNWRMNSLNRKLVKWTGCMCNEIVKCVWLAWRESVMSSKRALRTFAPDHHQQYHKVETN